ncbi:MAG: hypothetical protein J3K34DRAFT_455991 [Monoraphidium minutum]|nr:MAG: hypothetical protein J3K34DRAFT_455991 [Monoraphidium minutum]
MARFVAVLAMVCMAQLTAAYPYFFYRLKQPCDAQPTKGYKGHGAPTADAKITFAVQDSAGKAMTAACPGTAHTIRLSFGEPRLALITSNYGNFTGSDEICPNRLAIDRSAPFPLAGYSAAAIQMVTLEIPCDATGPLQLRVTSAAGPREQYKQATTTVRVNPACAAPSCAATTKATTTTKAAPAKAAPAKAAAKPKAVAAAKPAVTKP